MWTGLFAEQRRSMREEKSDGGSKKLRFLTERRSGTLACFPQPRLSGCFFLFVFFFSLFAHILSQIQMNAAFMAEKRILAGRTLLGSGGGVERERERKWDPELWQGLHLNRPTMLCNRLPAACAVFGKNKPRVAFCTSGSFLCSSRP